MTQTVLRPDPSRPALRLPLVGLGAAILGGGVAFGFGSRRGIDVLVAATLGFAWLRVWIARAQLVMNADGVGLSVPLSRWHVRWVDLESVGVTSFLTPTLRGGVGAGVRLRLRDAS